MNTRHTQFRSTIVLMILIGTLLMVSTASASDKAYELYELAKEELNAENYSKAAKIFEKMRNEADTDKMTAKAMYWEAFALYKTGKTRHLKSALTVLEQQIVDFEIQAKRLDSEDLATRIYAELADRGDPQADRKIDEVSHDEQTRAETRIIALDALMHMEPRRARPMLMKIINNRSEDPELRRHAVFVLCRNSDDESIDILINLLKTEDDPDFINELVTCLARTDSDRAVDTLIDLYHRTDDDQVRDVTLYALGRNGGEASVQFLTGVVRDHQANSDIRSQAMFALTRSGHDDEVKDLLINILKTEDDSEMVEMALFSLSRMGDTVEDEVFLNLIHNPKADDELRSQALFFAARNGRLNADELLKIYKATDSHGMKEQICHALTKMDDDDAALEMLIDMARTERDPELKSSIIFNIGRFDNDRAAEFLFEIISDE